MPTTRTGITAARTRWSDFAREPPTSARCLLTAGRRCAIRKDTALPTRFILLTGCSGGGKSTVLNALNDCGFATVEEPGRRIVADEIAKNGKGLPWIDMRAFALRAFELAKSDLEKAGRHSGLVFFDRGIVDAAIALEYSGGPSISETLGKNPVYADPVLVFPPWEEIFEEEAERRHDFDAAVQEYHRICTALDQLGCISYKIPRLPVHERLKLITDVCR